MLETLPPAAKQKLPHNLEECQKKVVMLERQLEASQAEIARNQTAADEEDLSMVKISASSLAGLRSKVRQILLKVLGLV